MPNLESNPDYAKLLQFLLQPLLNPSESISLDCEELNSTKRVWLRVAVNTADKGHIYGRGSRNLQAIRTVLSAAAKANKQSLYLDVYGSDDSTQDSYSKEGEPKKSPTRRTSNSKPKLQ